MNIQAFWGDILAQDRVALPAYFCPEAVIRWHCTNEQFSADEFIRVNCDYPGNWDGTIERMEQHEHEVITVVRVFPRDRSESWHVVSFLQLKGDRIVSLDEYWADDGDAPAWRNSMGIGSPINREETT